MSAQDDIFDVRYRKVHMSTITTTLLSVGPKAIHPWGDRAWKVALQAQYCSGSSADFWLVAPTQPAQHEVGSDIVMVQHPDHQGVLDSLVYLLALHLGNEEIEGYLHDHHNVTMDGDKRVPVEFWELTTQTRMDLARRLSKYLRLGITVLDESALVDPLVVRDLRSLGFDVDVFLLHDSNLVS